MVPGDSMDSSSDQSTSSTRVTSHSKGPRRTPAKPRSPPRSRRAGPRALCASVAAFKAAARSAGSAAPLDVVTLYSSQAAIDRKSAEDAIKSLPAATMEAANSLLADLPAPLLPLIIAKSTVRRGKGGRQPAADPRLDPQMDPKKAKRILANRQSAARSKLKQKLLLEGLRAKQLELAATKAKVEAETAKVRREVEDLEAENQQLESTALMLKASTTVSEGSSGASIAQPDGPAVCPPISLEAPADGTATAGRTAAAAVPPSGLCTAARQASGASTLLAAAAAVAAAGTAFPPRPDSPASVATTAMDCSGGGAAAAIATTVPTGASNSVRSSRRKSSAAAGAGGGSREGSRRGGIDHLVAAAAAVAGDTAGDPYLERMDSVRSSCGPTVGASTGGAGPLGGFATTAAAAAAVANSSAFTSTHTNTTADASGHARSGQVSGFGGRWHSVQNRRSATGEPGVGLLVGGTYRLGPSTASRASAAAAARRGAVQGADAAAGGGGTSRNGHTRGVPNAAAHGGTGPYQYDKHQGALACAGSGNSMGFATSRLQASIERRLPHAFRGVGDNRGGSAQDHQHHQQQLWGSSSSQAPTSRAQTSGAAAGAADGSGSAPAPAVAGSCGSYGFRPAESAARAGSAPMPRPGLPYQASCTAAAAALAGTSRAFLPTSLAPAAAAAEKDDLVSMECIEDTESCLLDASLVMPHSSSPAVLYDPLMSHYLMQGAGTDTYWQGSSHGSGSGFGAFLS